MWVLKFLNGERAGQTVPLKWGANVIGRDPKSDIVISRNGVSKSHAKIDVSSDRILLLDTQSRNGTFVNGTAIASHVVKPGQRISFDDVLCEILPARALSVVTQNEGALALKANPPMESAPQVSDAPATSSDTPRGLDAFVETVVMPSVYRLPTVVEFKNVFWIIGFALVISITALSTIPLTGILKKRIEKTSQQRAMTIARTLALRNQPILAAGQITGLTVTEASNEPGVDKAFVIDTEGRILAPAVMAQRDPEIPFISEARRLGKEVVQQIDDSTIGALVPIAVSNDQGFTQALAHAVVVYDMGALAVDDGQTLSLFVQTLIIALILGGIAFFLLWKLVTFPITQLDSQVQTVLREDRGTLQSAYKFPEWEHLVGNIQSGLTRHSGGPGFTSMGAYDHERSFEAAGLVNMVGFPALAVRAVDLGIVAVNAHFGSHIARGQVWTHSSLNSVTDQALRLNLLDVVDQAKTNPNQTIQSSIDIDSVDYVVQGQAVYGSKEVGYVLISFSPKAGGE
jgi:hypothetical protein